MLISRICTHLFKVVGVIALQVLVFNLERRCAKFVWSCLNSDNSIVKTIAKLAMCFGVSNFEDIYRYLSYKYKIRNHLWESPLCKLHKCFDSFSLMNALPNVTMPRCNLL